MKINKLVIVSNLLEVQIRPPDRFEWERKGKKKTAAATEKTPTERAKIGGVHLELGVDRPITSHIYF